MEKKYDFLYAKIVKIDENTTKIQWSELAIGFGEIIIKWDDNSMRYIINPEMMSFDFVVAAYMEAKKTEDDKPAE